MSADNRKQELRSLLAGKNTAELEELLALEATEFDAAGPDAEYIAVILEVIAQRENEKNNDNDAELTRQAWEDFQEYYELRQQEALETDRDEAPHNDHPRKTEYGQRSRKISRVLRYGIIAAVLAVLLCGTALGWNFFQTVANWTEETFHFLTGNEGRARAEEDVFRAQRLSVEKRTDAAALPSWAPAGTETNGSLKENERKDRYVVQATYTVDAREFTVQIIIHAEPPEVYTITYQKNSDIEEEYLANGITHYIMGNTETLSVMWLNGCVEGHIQGELTLEELRQMIDSIYEE